MIYSTNKNGKADVKALSFIVLFSVLLVLVSAAIGWNTEAVDQIYSFNEDNPSPYLHNFTLNVTTVENLSNFSINPSIATEWNFTWNSIDINVENISSWIFFNYSSLGMFVINSTTDYRSGTLEIPIQILSTEGGEQTRSFTFDIYPVNDEPSISYYNSTYTFPADEIPQGSLEYNETYNITVYDEEISEGTGNPLNFSYNITNCSLAGWLNQSSNCNDLLSGLSLELMSGLNDTSLFYYSYNESEVGNYTLNITIEDNSSCDNLEALYNNTICNSTYEEPNIINQTIIRIIESALDINIAGCDNQNFSEGENASCNITIRTRYPEDTVNLSSIAYFANNLWESPSNPYWFYQESSNTSDSLFLLEVPISIDTSKSNIGNWTINFTADDTRSPITKPFNISIEENSSDGPSISSIAPPPFSTYSLKTINFNVTDLDFLIEDKSVYNESINFDIDVKYANGTSTGNLFNSSFFNITKINVTDEIQYSKIEFVPSPEHVGDFNVTINAADQESLTDSTFFNMVIESNNYPEWNDSETYDFNLTVNSTYATTTDYLLINLTNEGYVYDVDDNSTLEFVIEGDYPENLNISNTTKVLAFSPWKQDVGYWEFNVTVIDDAELSNTSTWRINVSNINSVPEISLTESLLNQTFDIGEHYTTEGNSTIIRLKVYDDDLFINNRNNETLSISEPIIQNQSVVPESLSFSFYLDPEEAHNEENFTTFIANFTPLYENMNGSIDTNYTIFIEVSDLKGETSNYTLNFTILSQNTPPTINSLENQSTSILNESFEYSINATDTRDDFNNLALNYQLSNLTPLSPNLNINSSTGLISFNFSNNESYAGEWTYNITVVDNDSASDMENITFFIYGSPNITTSNTTILNLSEGISSLLNFSLDYAINNTNLTYNLSLDNIIYNSSDSINYTNQTVVQTGTFIYQDSEPLSINFTPDYSDETYINFTKNFTLNIFNLDYLDLLENDTWQTNITHSNQNISFNEDIEDRNGTVGVPISINLSNYFEDVDAFDNYWNQHINFTINRMDSNDSSSFSPTADIDTWILNFSSSSAKTEMFNVTAWEYETDDNSTLLNNVTSNSFNITFESSTSDTPTNPSSGSSSSRTDHYALKIITPDNVKISEEDYILVNFSLYNNGDVTLSGIDLSSLIELSGITSEDLKITFSDDYVESLKVGETKNYSMRVDVNTGAVGKYDITIMGNVTSPKFSDWATFSIEVLAVDESQLSQLLIFTEKLVSENPECLELRESYSEAQTLYDSNKLVEANQLLNNIITACKESISRNEQIKKNEKKVKTKIIYKIIKKNKRKRKKKKKCKKNNDYAYLYMEYNNFNSIDGIYLLYH